MQIRQDHSSVDEKVRRRVNAAVNRLILETGDLEDAVRSAVTEVLGHSLPAGWLDHHSAEDVERTYAVRVPVRRAAGISEADARRIARVHVSELVMDSLREAVGALAHVDGHRLPDSFVLTLLVRHLLDVRRVETEAEVSG
jgi:hypothetical protein